MASFLNSAGDWWNGGGKSFVGEGLSDLGYGLANSTNIGNGLGVAARQTVALQPARDLQAEKIAAQKQQALQLQTAIANLRDKYQRPDLADAVSQGYDVNKAWQDVLTKKAPISVSSGETLLDPMTMQPMYTAPSVTKEPTAPTGYQFAPTDPANPAQPPRLSFIPGGPADPSTAAKTTEATRRNQQLAKVIIPEVKNLLGDGTPQNPGTFDALSSWGAQAADAMGPLGLVLTGGPDANYQQAKNSLKTIIASYLYSVSGATANPGEVDTQASVLTPKPGEPAASVAAKKARIATMVQAVVDAAKGTPIDVNDASLPTGLPAAPGPSGNVLTYNPVTGELE